jgi:hypothetical protein
MNPESRRYRRELLTLQRMLEIWCRDRAHTRAEDDSLCAACAELLHYADGRLLHCPWGEQKPQCARCTIHCYSPARREQAREVMRYAGPRMLARHPVLATLHIADKLRPSPVLPKKVERREP